MGLDGKQHTEYKTFDDFREALVLRSTGILIHTKPVLDRADPLIQAHHSKDESPLPDEPQWDFAHTLDTAADEVYIIADDGNLYRNLSVIPYFRLEKLHLNIRELRLAIGQDVTETPQ
jgi:hypothetical protein